MVVTPQSIREVLDQTNWPLLAQQKLTLVDEIASLHVTRRRWIEANEKSAADLALEASRGLEGILHWIDALQDAASAEGYPVVFLTEDDSEEEAPTEEPFDPVQSAIDEMRETDRIEAQFNYPEGKEDE